MFWWIIGIIAVIVIIILYYILTFNSLVVLENRIDNAWSQIDVQLKKRVDLIPNLVSTVKGYAKHEKGVFTEVTQARANLMRSKDPAARIKNNNMLTDALTHLFAVAESYPQLQASRNFLQLQEELAGVEGKIAYARQFYNDSVLKFNNLTEMFPSSIVASMSGKNKQRPYFEVSEKERAAPQVSF